MALNVYILLNQVASLKDGNGVDGHEFIGGAEVQAMRLSQRLKQSVNVSIVSKKLIGQSKFEQNDTLKIFRYGIPKIILRLREKSYAKRKRVLSIDDFDWTEKAHNTYRPKKYNAKAFVSHLMEFVAIVVFLMKHKRQIDILYIPMLSYMGQIGTLAAKITGVKIVLNDATNDGLEQMYNCFAPDFSRRQLVDYAHFVAKTRDIKQMYLRNGVSEEKIKVIHNGIDLPECDKAIRRRKTFLFVGNLFQQPAKGVDVLMLAWQGVVKTHPDARLFIAGGGEQDFIAHAERLGIADSITFTGKTDPVEYYKTCEVFVLPSRREGMSNALMEAMAYGMPVIGTDISGTVDLLENEQAGELIPPNNVVALEKSMIGFAAADKKQLQKMGDNAKEAVRQKCNFETVSARFAEYFEQVYLS